MIYRGSSNRLSFEINTQATYFWKFEYSTYGFSGKIFNIKMKIILKNNNTTDSMEQ
jgi:hypothetical protein